MDIVTDATSGMEAKDRRFFRGLIVVMAVVLVSGFVVNLALGRSSFGAPPVVHAHAIVFMGWAVIVVVQALLAGGGAFRWHRLLGRVAVVWTLAMLALGPLVTLNAVATGRVPFFFQAQHFLLADPLTLIAALALFAAAVLLRHRADWHARLQVGSFSLLLGPGFGRLLPMPFLKPWAFEVASAAAMVFVLVGALRDLRDRGRIHPAWAWPVVALVLALGAARGLGLSPAGDALFHALVGDPAADGRAFPPPPHG